MFDGIDVDGRFAKNLALEHSGGTGITVRNSRVGNVTDEKGAIIGESGFTFDNVTFHDVLVTDSSVHNECVYATGAEGLTVRNSRFYNCATMDLFFTNWAGGPGLRQRDAREQRLRALDDGGARLLALLLALRRRHRARPAAR